MSPLIAYHRPTTVEAVLQLLARPDVNTVLIAGGTYINAHLDELVDEVVDLQALGLDTIQHGRDQMTLGAMVRLQTIVAAEGAPAILRQMALREGPNTLRNAATIGGLVVGADWESELLAALLVLEAEVEVCSPQGREVVALLDFLADPQRALKGGLATAISLKTGGKTTSDRVARTPADRPIVAAVGRLAETGQNHLAISGVASTPILVDPDRLASTLNPPADFRGSSAYRRQMALTLARRVIATLRES